MVAAMSSRLNLLMLSLLLMPRATFAQISSAETSDYFEFLTRANHYSPLEHAGSHGTLGVSIAVGLSSYETPASSEAMKDHWRRSGASAEANPQNRSRLNLAQIHILKGLPYSLDIGGGFAKDSFSNAKFISAYGQWTAYEAFAMPALAVRGQYSRLMGLATTDASSLEASMLASYGFLRQFTIYGAYGVGRHNLAVHVGPSYGTTLSLDGETDGLVGRVLIRNSKSFGMQYQALPPFCSITAEFSQVGQGPLSLMAKVAVGI